MGLLDDIKDDVRRSGSNKSKLIFFRPDTKKRVRFLQDLEEGYELDIHGHWDEGVTAVCGHEYGHSCKYCDINEELVEDDESPKYDTKTNYVWSVYDYDDNQVKIMCFKVNRCSPIPPLVAMYENYGTLVDRDYVITQIGKGTSKSFTIIPQDKSKFRNSKAKPFSKQAVLKVMLEAWPDTKTWDDDEKLSKKAKAEEVEDTSDYDSELGSDYESMKPMELFKLCKERKIEAEKKKPKAYYVNLLEEWDKAQEDWGNDSDDDDWDDGDWEDED